MAPPSPRLSSEIRASLFHFTVYSTIGAGAAYLAIWMSGHGISAGEIGIVNAAPVLVLLAVNLFVGRLADRASDWRQMIILLALIAGVAPLGFFFFTSFIGVLVVWTLIAAPSGAITPILDAATLRMTERNGSSFGGIRGWGTLGSMAATAGTGLIVGFFGPEAFLPTLLIFALARAGLSLQLPRFRAPDRALTIAAPKPVVPRERLKLWFVLPIVAFAMVQATHAILNGFAALIWIRAGVPQGVVGLLLATSPAAEAVVMFFWRRLGLRVSARQMVLASCVAATVRWAAVALGPPVPVLFALQAMHSVTFAVGYLGIVHFIANWTREDVAAEMQSFSYVLQQGASVVGLSLFGWLAGPFGAGAFFASALLGVVGMVCVLVSLKLNPPRDAQAGPALQT
jgi:MFS transporter, PPP family, 3-phenylpropionic acid transporter